MAIKRIPASAIHAGQPYRDGEIITGTMVNEVVKVLKDGVNYNKFFIDAMFAGTTEEAIVIGVPKGEPDTYAQDIVKLEEFITAKGITVDDGQKAFVFRCIYGNVDDPTEITGVQALNYYKYVTDAWVHQYAVSMDTFIQGLSSDFTDYPNIVEPSLDSVLVVQNDDVLNRVSLQNIKNVLGVTELLEVTVPAIEQDIDEILDGTQTVKKAEQDASGNVITTTYETKADATSKKSEIDGRLNTAESEITKIKDGTTIVKKAEQDKNGNTIDLTYATKTENNQKAEKTYVDNNIDIIEEALASKEVIANKGQPNGYAPVGADGYIPSVFIPNSFDDVLEFDTYASLLAYATPTTSKLYIVKADETSGGNHSTYRYTGTIYVRISDEMSASEIKALYESNANTNAFTDALKNKLDGLLNGSQYYDKTYIDALKDQNGWKSQLLTLTPLAPSETIATATLLLHNTLKLQVKNTSISFVDTDSIEVTIGVVTGNKILLNGTDVYLEIGATNSTFVAPAGWELQIVGLKYTELKASDVATNEVGVTVQDKLDEIVTESYVPATNILPDGSFETAVTFDLDCVVGAKALKIVAASSVTYLTQVDTVNLIAGHKYYCAIWGKSATVNPRITIYLDSASEQIAIRPNEWMRVSTVLTAPLSGDKALTARFFGTFVAGDFILFDGKLLIDMTATFGVGKEPARDEMDDFLKVYEGLWFNGTVNLNNGKAIINKINANTKKVVMTGNTFMPFVNDAVNRITVCGVDSVGDTHYGNDETNLQFKTRTGLTTAWSTNKGYPANVTFINKIVRFKEYLYAIALDNSDGVYKIFRALPTAGNAALVWSTPLLILDDLANARVTTGFNASADYIFVGEYGDPAGGPILYRSADGVVWSNIWSDPTCRHIHAVNCDPFYPGHVWMATGENGKIYRSIDNGTTWLTVIAEAGWQAVQISFDKKYVHFAGDSTNQSAYAIDREELKPFLTSNNYHCNIAVPGGAAGETFYRNAFYGAVDPETGVFYLLAQDTSAGGNVNGLFTLIQPGWNFEIRAYKMANIMAGPTSGTEIYYHKNKVLFSQYWLYRISALKTIV